MGEAAETDDMEGGSPSQLPPPSPQWVVLRRMRRGLVIHPFSPSSVTGDDHTSIVSGNSSLTTITKTTSSLHKHRPYVELEIGDTVIIFEQYGEDWARGYVWPMFPIKSPTDVGLFPLSYIRVCSELPGDEEAHEEDEETVVGEELKPDTEIWWMAKRVSARLLSASMLEDRRLEDRKSVGQCRSLSCASYSTQSVSCKCRVVSDTGSSVEGSDRSSAVAEEGISGEDARGTGGSGDRIKASGQSASRETVRYVPHIPLRARFCRSRRMEREGSVVCRDFVWGVSSVIKEWTHLLPNHICNRDYDLFQQVATLTEILLNGRRQLLSGTLSEQATKNLVSELAVTINEGNRIQSLDAIVRVPETNEIATMENMGGMWSLYRLYGDRESLDSLSSLAATHSDATSHPQPHQLWFELKASVAVIAQPGQQTQFQFQLYSNRHGRFISEVYECRLNHLGMPVDNEKIGNLRTIFADVVCSENEKHEVWMVCRVFILKDSGNGKVPVIRVPYGCGVAKVGSPSPGKPIGREHAAVDLFDGEPELRMDIYCVAERAQLADFHVELIENASSKEMEAVQAKQWVILVSKWYRCLLKDVVATRPDLPITAPLPLPNLVSMDIAKEERNDVFLTLYSGSFPVRGGLHQGLSHGLHHAARKLSSGGGEEVSVQVSVEVRDKLTHDILPYIVDPMDGRVGEGIHWLPTSTVPHSNSLIGGGKEVLNSVWKEMIKLTIPAGKLPDVYLLFKVHSMESPRNHLFNLSAATHNTENKARGKVIGFAHFSIAQFKYGGNYVIVPNDHHSLPVYQWESAEQPIPSLEFEKSNTICGSDSSTIGQVSVASSSTLRPVRSARINVEVMLYSTRYTHSESLLDLLNCVRERMSEDAVKEGLCEVDKVRSVLRSFVYIPPTEIAKFLAPVLNCLFTLFVRYEEVAEDALRGLIAVLALDTDRRIVNFEVAFRRYLECEFSDVAAVPVVLESASKLVAQARDDAQSEVHLRATIKVWPLLGRIFARAFEILAKAGEEGGGAEGGPEGGLQTDGALKQKLKAYFHAISSYLARQPPHSSVVATQTLVYRKFPLTLHILDPIFQETELVSLALQFVNAVPVEDGEQVAAAGPLVLARISMVRFWASNLFARLTEERASFAREVVGLLNEYLKLLVASLVGAKLDNAGDGRLRVSRLCFVALAELAQEAPICPLLAALPSLLEICRALLLLHAGAGGVSEKAAAVQAGLLDGMAALLDILNRAAEGGYGAGGLLPALRQTLSESSPGDAAKWMRELLEVLATLAKGDVFPGSWLNANAAVRQVVLHVLQSVCSVMRESFLPDPNLAEQFDEELWSSVLNLLLDMLTGEHLQLENLLPQRQMVTYVVAGADLRDVSVKLLWRTWDSLTWERDGCRSNGYQTKFGSALLKKFLELSISQHTSSRACATSFLFTRIVGEYALTRDIKRVEKEFVVGLDWLVISRARGDDTGRHLFILGLAEKFNSRRQYLESELLQMAMSFLRQADRFLQLLLSVRSFPSTEFEEERVMYILHLLKFMQNLEQNDIYVKYVHCLADVQLAAKNYLEAGLTLKLHADLLEWDAHTRLPACQAPAFPAQSAFERKEQLYLRIIDHFATGHAHERAWRLCRELATQYEHTVFDYARLADILRRQALCAETIARKERCFGEYFRVCYYGRGFPAVLRNKQYIYRGLEWEKLGEFCDRMQSRHPNAVLLRTPLCSQSPFAGSVRRSDGQFLQITAVQPEPDRKRGVFLRADYYEMVPPSIRAYYEWNEINTFSFSRPVHKPGLHFGGEREQPENPLGTAANGADFLNLWAEKTVLVTEHTLPSVARRSEVVQMEVIGLSPIENAIQTVRWKNEELMGFLRTYAGCGHKPPSTNPLSMALDGVVNAPVNGGVSMYRHAFLNEHFPLLHPEQRHLVKELRDVIDQQALVTGRCLELHQRVAPAEMRPLHENLVVLFEKNFAEEVARIKRSASTAPFQYVPPAPILAEGGGLDMHQHHNGPSTSPPPVLPHQPSDLPNAGHNHHSREDSAFSRAMATIGILSEAEKPPKTQALSPPPRHHSK